MHFFNFNFMLPLISIFLHNQPFGLLSDGSTSTRMPSLTEKLGVKDTEHGLIRPSKIRSRQETLTVVILLQYYMKSVQWDRANASKGKPARDLLKYTKFNGISLNLIRKFAVQILVGRHCKPQSTNWPEVWNWGESIIVGVE